MPLVKVTLITRQSRGERSGERNMSAGNVSVAHSQVSQLKFCYLNVGHLYEILYHEAFVQC